MIWNFLIKCAIFWISSCGSVLEALRARHSLHLYYKLNWLLLLWWSFNWKFWLSLEFFLGPFDCCFFLLLHWTSLAWDDNFFSLHFSLGFLDEIQSFACTLRCRFSSPLNALLVAFRLFCAGFDVLAFRWLRLQDGLALSVLLMEAYETKSRLTSWRDRNKEWTRTWWTNEAICGWCCRPDRRDTKRLCCAQGCFRLATDRFKEYHFRLQRVWRGTVARRFRRRAVMICFRLGNFRGWGWWRIRPWVISDLRQERNTAIKCCFEDVVVFVGHRCFNGLCRWAAGRCCIAKTTKRSRNGKIAECLKLNKQQNLTSTYFGSPSFLVTGSCCGRSGQSAFWLFCFVKSIFNEFSSAKKFKCFKTKTFSQIYPLLPQLNGLIAVSSDF